LPNGQERKGIGFASSEWRIGFLVNSLLSP
jgi:hypothetical protein